MDYAALKFVSNFVVVDVFNQMVNKDVTIENLEEFN